MALTKFNNSRTHLNCAADGADRDELAAWAETIPFEELWDKIRELTGLSDLSFDYKITSSRSPVSIHFASQDLADKTDFLRLMFETLRIEQFNSQVLIKEIDGVPTKLWWGTVCFYYKHPSGGRNSTDFMSFRYIDGEGWTFAPYSSDT